LQNRLDTYSPGTMLLGAMLCGLTGIVLAVHLALSTPWLGLTLQAQPGQAGLLVQHSTGPAAAVPAGTRLMALEGPAPSSEAAPSRRMELQPVDLIEEPDLLPTYAEVGELLARQSALGQLLNSGEPLRLHILHAETGRADVVQALPEARPLASLPGVFWSLQLYGLCAILLGCWVWALRPRDWGARAFGLTGFMLFVSASAAAVYGSRELALDGGLFRMLSMVNHAGATLFGCALIMLFMAYPRMLLPARWLALPFVVYLPWLALDSFHMLPNPFWGSGLIYASQTLIAVALALFQWRHTRHNPVQRAALRWMSLSTFTGCALFVISMALPHLVGEMPMSQSTAFGFFMLMYAGLAMGVRQYRLFALDEWAFRILLYVVGAIALLVLDALFLFVLHLNAAISLSLALVITGFAYLPLRNLLWSRLVNRQALDQGQLFRAVLDVTLAPTRALQAERWRGLLQTMFTPLDITALAPAQAPAEPEIREQGLALALPADAGQPALQLSYPWRGRGLFGPAHLLQARELLALRQDTQASRAAFERGVAHERQRIAQDLHDDVGAMLLTSLHQPDMGQVHQTLRSTIAEIRSIVSGLSGETPSLAEALASMRYEAGQRLDAAGVALQWQEPPLPDTALDYRIAKNLSSALREMLSNTLRHAQAKAVRIALRLEQNMLHMEISDDGKGMDAAAQTAGHGLRNVQRRMADIGGQASARSSAAGVCVHLSLPLPSVPSSRLPAQSPT